ncbi:MAG TPA: hypothetical protein PK655_03390 [archaeon]|jgi:hypothetical protein|nr:hypothetical protein [archaeon]HPV66467.1 hypothetical protein [archaeon]
MLYETQFLLSLLITVVIEVIVVFLISKFVFKYNLKEQTNLMIVCVFASALTLPYLWFVIPPYIVANYYLIVGELFVVVIEIIIYKLFTKANWLQAIVISVVANVMSFLLGLFIY